jgi:NDP-sugar pyrophosphorylase family protein
MKNIKLIIPMSGIGKRFIDAGYVDPKPLIVVDGKPIIEHVVNLFPGITDVSFICNEKHVLENNIKETLTNISPNSTIYTIPNGVVRGPVESVLQIIDNIDDESEIIVSYCDYGTYWDFDGFLTYVRENNLDGAIPCYKGFHPHMLGTDNYAFCREENNLLIEIKEKEPFTNNRMNEFASNGTYYFKNGKILKKYFTSLVDKGIRVNDEFYVSLVYNLLINDGLKVGIFEIDNMLQWGTPYDLETYKGWSDYFKNIMIDQREIKNDDETTLVLPMAGRGSRFSEIGFKEPKPLIDVNGKPMVIQAINCLPKSKNNVFICLKSHIEKFKIDETLSSYYDGCKILDLDKTTEGQACTCELGINEFNLDPEKPIMISACDNGVYYDRKKYEELVLDTNNDIIVWSFRNNQTSKVNPDMYAWLDVDKDNNIKHVSCKKFIYDDPLKTHAIIGTMYFRKAKYFLDGLQKNYKDNIRTNGEFYVDDVLNQNIKDGLTVKVFEVKNYICWGTPNDYLTYTYWRDFFDKCTWHPYIKENDITTK